MLAQKYRTKERFPEQLREHYEIEKELAYRLRTASPEQRRHLYGRIYEELFRKVPHHPQLIATQNSNTSLSLLADQLQIIRPFIHAGCRMLEIGCGDAAIARAVAPFLTAVYALDVSPSIMQLSSKVPKNLIRITFDGYSLPLRETSIDFAYSNQLIEHLHPDDAREQLHAIYRVLKPGGKYLCITPNRLSGPYDISGYFDPVATCLHLHEYTVFELADLFASAGFCRLRIILGASRRLRFSLTPLPVVMVEKILLRLPSQYAVACARKIPLGALRIIRLVGEKL